GGSVASLGRNYVIGLQATNCRTGDSLAHEQREVDSREKVLQAVGQAASALRRKLGESLPSIQNFYNPPEATQTWYLEALKAYSLAEDTRSRLGGLESVPLYKRAIELDPNFALAYARLGVVYGNLGEAELSKEYIGKAFALRDRVSEREKLYLEQHYYRMITGEIDKNIEVLELHRHTYPRDFTAANNLMVAYMMIGEREKALAAAEESVRLEPRSALARSNLAAAYRLVGRREEAKKTCQDAAAQGLDGMNCRRELYRLAFLDGDDAEMRRQVEWARGNAEEYSMRLLDASSNAARGRFRQARELYREGCDMATRRGLKQV